MTENDPLIERLRELSLRGPSSDLDVKVHAARACATETALLALPLREPSPDLDARIRAARHTAALRSRRHHLAAAAAVIMAIGLGWLGLELRSHDAAPSQTSVAEPSDPSSPQPTPSSKPPVTAPTWVSLEGHRTVAPPQEIAPDKTGLLRRAGELRMRTIDLIDPHTGRRVRIEIPEYREHRALLPTY